MYRLEVKQKKLEKITHKDLIKLLSMSSTCSPMRRIRSELEEIKAGISNIEFSLDEEYKETYLKLLEGNKQYVRETLRKNPKYFKDISLTQKPKYLLIGCSDSRVPPNEMTKTEPGEIFIHRNIGNQVLFSDLNCMSVIQYAVEHLKVEHIIVMGHTKCGGIKCSTIKKYYGMIEQWLQNIRDIALVNKSELENIKCHEEFLNRLTIMNVKAQALNVCKTPFVQRAWAEGRTLNIHGWLMHIETGLIEDLSITNKDWDDIKNIYDFTFDSL